MTIDEIDWDGELNPPNEATIQHALNLAYRSHNYMIAEVNSLLHEGKIGKAWGILTEMEPQDTEICAERHYFLSHIYIKKNDWCRANLESLFAHRLMPEKKDYEKHYKNIHSEYKRQNKPKKRRWIYASVFLLVLAAAGALCYISSPERQHSLFSEK